MVNLVIFLGFLKINNLVTLESTPKTPNGVGKGPTVGPPESKNGTKMGFRVQNSTGS